MERPLTAAEFFEQSLAIARETGDRASEGAGPFHLGIVLDPLNERTRAIFYTKTALKIFINSWMCGALKRMIGDRQGEAHNLWNLSLAFYKLGRHGQAILLAE